MTISSLKEAVDFLYSFIDYERLVAKEKPALSLESFKMLCEYFDNPYKKFKSIHIAGTKGKGSVTAFLANIFFKNNFKTGMFISPHIHKINERIRINNKDISDEDFVRIINKIKKILDENKEKLRSSYRTTFELITLCAFLYFAESNLDIAVLETGMGGRFDTTNVVTPLVSIITSIGLDHTFYLGDTIEQIAREKAGIIKNNVPVIVSPQDKNIENLFKEIAQEKSASCYLVSECAELTDRIIYTMKQNHTVSLREEISDKATSLREVNIDETISLREADSDEAISLRDVGNGLKPFPTKDISRITPIQSFILEGEDKGIFQITPTSSSPLEGDDKDISQITPASSSPLAGEDKGGGDIFQTIICRIFDQEYANIQIPLMGMHQVKNILTVLTAIEVLKQNGFKSPRRGWVTLPFIMGEETSPLQKGALSEAGYVITDKIPVLQSDAIKEGIKTTKWEGRIEILQPTQPTNWQTDQPTNRLTDEPTNRLTDQPIFIVDGAHCPLSAKALSETIQEVFNPKIITLIFGVLQDKDLDAIIKNFIVEEIEYKFIAVPVDTPRGMKVDKVTEVAKKYFNEVYQCENINNAITKALQITNKNDLIVAFGSIYNIAPIKIVF